MSGPDVRPARRRRRGPVPQITRDDIVDAAMHLGLQDVTMREVAAHLGVSVQGLYHYVRTREDLLGAAASRLVGRVTLPEPEASSWVDWTLGAAWRIWDELDSHPGVAAVSLANAPREDGNPVARRSVAVLHDHYGLPAGIAMQAIISVVTVVFAFHMQDESMATNAPQRSRMSEDPAFPFPPAPRELAEFALHAVLDGVEAQIRRDRGRPAD